MGTSVEISIIMPIYNAAAFLEKSLASLTSQTFYNVEFICVDDGSTDDSWAILQEKASSDDRFRIYHKENEGVSIARNFGLEKASGRYVMFLDADDWYEERTCQRAYELITEKDYDIVLFSMSMEYGSSQKYCDILECEARAFDERQCRELYRKSVGLIGTECRRIMKIDYLSLVYLKIYKKSIIDDNHIRFKDIREIGSFEDGLFNLQYLKCIKSAYYTPEILYHYNRTNEHSITSKYRENLSNQWRNLFSTINEEISMEKDKSFALALKNRKAYAMATLGLNIMSGEISKKEKYQQWKALMKNSAVYQAFTMKELFVMPKGLGMFFFFVKIKCNRISFALLQGMYSIRKRKKNNL